MAAQRGKDLLIKLDMTGAGVFETVAGLRATRITFNAETVDVTNLGSAGRWRELLAGRRACAARRSAGSGVFRDEATDERARAIFFAGEIPALPGDHPGLRRSSRGRSRSPRSSIPASTTARRSTSWRSPRPGALSFAAI